MIEFFNNIFNKKRIALVGPSPHLKGKGMGKFFDSFDYIIRINEVVPNFLSEDYGSRNDIVFLSIPNNSIELYKNTFEIYKNEVSNVKYFISPRNSLHVTPYHLGNFIEDNNIFNNFEELNINHELFHIGNDENNKIESEIGTHPSTGTLTLGYLSQFKFKSLFVAGFSFYMKRKRYHKTKAKIYDSHFDNINSKKSGHDTLKEIEYLSKIYSKNNNAEGDNWFTQIVKNKNYKTKNGVPIAPIKLRLFD